MPLQHVDSPAGPEIPYSVVTYSEAFASGERPRCSYCSNNGVLAVVDGKGTMRVTPFTEARARALDEAGFTSASWSVPFSNGGMNDAMAKWFDSIHRLDDEDRAERVVIPQIPGAELMTSEAKRVSTYRVLTYSVIGKSGNPLLGGSAAEDEPAHICYVTLHPEGNEYNLYKAPYTQEAEQQLREAGFKRDVWHPGIITTTNGVRSWMTQLMNT